MTKLPFIIMTAPPTRPVRVAKVLLLMVTAEPDMMIIPPKSKRWLPLKVLSTICTVELLMISGAD